MHSTLAGSLVIVSVASIFVINTSSSFVRCRFFLTLLRTLSFYRKSGEMGHGSFEHLKDTLRLR